MKYYSAKTVTKMLGVTAQTLRNWDKEGKLKPSYVQGNGYRYYSEEVINKFTHQRNVVKNKLIVVGYARVSSKKQEDDLNSQVNNLNQYLSNKYENYEIITDIGSGINYAKPGLKKLIEQIQNKQVDKIVVLYKDRLLRFGFELVEYFAKLNDVTIDILDNENKCENQELVEDLIHIVTVFSSEFQGRRKKKTKEIIEQFNRDIKEEYKL